jgi:hypothetical protein
MTKATALCVEPHGIRWELLPYRFTPIPLTPFEAWVLGFTSGEHVDVADMQTRSVHTVRALRDDVTSSGGDDAA